MNADEIRKLAAENIFVEVTDKRDIGEGEVCDYSYEKKSEINAALLAYAAMTERCEEMYNKFCMKFSVNSDKAKTNPQFMKVAILLDDMFNYILKGATDERK